MEKFKLSHQACGALMLAVQKGCSAAMRNRPKEECDIVKILTGFQLMDTGDGLIVLNPPTVDFNEEDYTDETVESLSADEKE